jgi:hypothetical protein
MGFTVITQRYPDWLGDGSLLLDHCDCSILPLVVTSSKIKIFRLHKTFGLGFNNSNNFYNIFLLNHSQIHINTSTFDGVLDF